MRTIKDIIRRIKNRHFIKQTENKYDIKIVLCDWIRSVDPQNKLNIGVLFKLTSTGILKIYSTHPGVLIGKRGCDYNKYKERLINRIKCIKTIKLYELKNFVDGKDVEIKNIDDII